MQFVTNRRIMSRRGPGKSWTMGFVSAGTIFNALDITGAYVAMYSNKWIPLSACTPTIPLPDVTPPPDCQNPNIYCTIRGDQKPAGYKPEGINFGSFDIVWLLRYTRIEKPEGFNLTPEIIEYIKRLNSYDPQKYGWLVDQAGNRKILSETASGIRLPVPCLSGNNPVNVLEIYGKFARIQTVSIFDKMPNTLPAYLCHTWHGFTKTGDYFVPRGGVRWPLLAWSNSAWIQANCIKPSAT